MKLTESIKQFFANVKSRFCKRNASKDEKYESGKTDAETSCENVIKRHAFTQSTAPAKSSRTAKRVVKNEVFTPDRHGRNAIDLPSPSKPTNTKYAQTTQKRASKTTAPSKIGSSRPTHNGYKMIDPEDNSIDPGKS